MAKINLTNYDYVIFVDASGDDGTQFENGSSLCFTTACFISSVDSLDSNKKVLDNMKRICGRLSKDELKHNTLRRHRMYLDALNELVNIKGSVAIHNSFKRDLVEDYLLKSPSEKRLSSFTHYFPLSVISKNETTINGNVLICIDRMKEIEMDTVKRLFESTLENNPFHLNNYEIIFRDSKAEGFELIQMADVMAGIWRNFFEETITNQDTITFINKCCFCWNSVTKHKLQNLCKIKRVKVYRNSLLNKPIKQTLPLVIKDDSNLMLCTGIVSFPVQKIMRYKFLECRK